MRMSTDNKISRLAHKKLGLKTPQDPHLLQALKRAKMPATQSALSRISNLKAHLGHLLATKIADTSSASTEA